MATITTIDGPRGRRYRVRYRNTEGQPRSKTLTKYEEARAFATTVEASKLTGTYVEQRHGRQTFGDWWAEWWETTVNLRPSTRAREESDYVVHIAPAFAKVPLSRIEHQHVRAWLAKLTVPKSDGGAGLAPATAAKALRTLRKAMRGAVRAKRIAFDPTDGVDPPRIEHEEMRFLDPDEVATLAAAIDERYRCFVLLGAYGGLRLGELAALRRSRIDLLRRGLDVVETVVEVKGKHVVNPPKTKAGRRWVPLPRFVCDELDEFLSYKNADDLVFPSPEGSTFLRAPNFRRRVWHPACVAAGVGEWRRGAPTEKEPDGKVIGYKGLRIHDLRHTAISLWIATGADPKEIAARAGHRSVVTVFDRYGHLLARRSDDVTEALDAMGRGAKPTRTAEVVTMRRVSDG